MPPSPPAWTRRAGLLHLPPWAERELGALPSAAVERGTVLFRPGQSARGFVVVLSGRIDVFLTGPTGREILLYSVEPGQSCVQTTLSLLGGEDYAGEAVAAEPAEVALIPRGLFLRLMDEAPPFRAFVFGAFGARMQELLRLLERVAFQRVESRLAAALLAMAEGDEVRATQAELATRVGTAREVVSRRLDGFARRGWVATDRGQVHLRDAAALRRLAAAEDLA
ncbi:Crp/Fnr family transcriptional regulator [Rubellimicrobium aerolatum]|uniref:Crp/Fnr family transcriptional regulator n=1 Tax=Rubellimicrobium aerolatum TaxID=490979 RepID=A0ABW0SC05_9RHOB|nr:Crp/Fnr family transcriptional regulator [Rubellimicrobium aerolatum]MBP1805979.1 CRP/FNR family transcriptional regulator [Rubellimicrobium aerolatum]